MPPPEWPTRATLRIFSGRSAVSNVAAPAARSGLLLRHPRSPLMIIRREISDPGIRHPRASLDKRSPKLAVLRSARADIVGATRPAGRYPDRTDLPAVLNIHARAAYRRPSTRWAAQLATPGVTPNVDHRHRHGRRRRGRTRLLPAGLVLRRDAGDLGLRDARHGRRRGRARRRHGERVRRSARLDVRPRGRRRRLRRPRLVLRPARPALAAARRVAVPGARLAHVLHPRARRGRRASPPPSGSPSGPNA